jgi:serine/threonine-protein kinase RsbW
MTRSAHSSTTKSPAARESDRAHKRLELRFDSDPANLAPAREAVERLAAAGGFDATSVGEIGLCLNEALANVMRHAYSGAVDRPIEVASWWEAGTLHVTIRDWGSGVNPQAQPEQEHNPLKPGGLGLICLRKLMDEMVFTPQRDGMHLAMKRTRK